MTTPFQSSTFEKGGSFAVDEAVGAASISPSGRDVVLASRQGLHIIDLDDPYSPPRHLTHRTPWEVADVQWSPFACRDYWVVSTSNRKALVWNLGMQTSQAPIEHVLQAHSRAVTDINFSAHAPDLLATCAVDSFVHCWDLRHPGRPAVSFANWFAGATQVKWNRQDEHVIASAHDKYLHIWDKRKGALPLKTIDAHATKIYGIDWNRASSTRLLTCSLDRTIKFWDYSQSDEIPERIIRTPYPVWRARHTPFGRGVLAMPQRGNYALHLYDRRLENESDRDAQAEPVHAFPGHQDQVKEFLWRSRGGFEQNVDMREFQLVSWSMDKNLRLHPIDDEILGKVGHRRGDVQTHSFNFTRRGAAYRSFRDENKLTSSPERSMAPPSHGLSGLFREVSHAGWRKSPVPQTTSTNTAGNRTGMQVRTFERKNTNPIKWMKGVKITKNETYMESGRDSAQRLTSSGAPPWDSPDSLGDEITYVGDKYKKVVFEEINIASRFLKIALNGPWGVDDDFVHIRISISFPQDYPETSPPSFDVEKRQSMSEVTFRKMTLGVHAIADRYATLGRGSFEGILGYLLGERGLEESTAWLDNEQNSILNSSVVREEESSSDEEDDLLGNFTGLPQQDMENSGQDVTAAVSNNANVPIPKACGALWTDDGRLICFFPRREESRSIMSTLNIEGSEKTLRSQRTFAGFGRLPLDSSRRGTRHSTSSDDSNSDDSDSSTSSSSASNSSASIDVFRNRFQFPASWQGSSMRRAHPRSAENSKSSIPTLSKHKTGNPKTFISIHNLEDLLPSKKCLAIEYELSGDGPSICERNEQIANKHGFDGLADIWALVQLILCNNVPLEVMQQPPLKDDIFVLARRSLVQINRKDSGLDLSFDDKPALKSSKFKGRVKWGQHPLSTWLIQAIFDHFEQVADIQMLAMLSCVLSEPPIQGVQAHITSNSSQETQSKAMILPAFTLEYFPSEDVVWSMVNAPAPGSDRGNPSTISPVAAYGSFHSSTGHWSDGMDNELALSSSTTPPTITRQHSRNSTSGQSFEGSPEQLVRRSNSSVSNSFAASISKPFSFMTSSSPPAQIHHRRQVELSSSLPSSGITWGRNTVYSEDPTRRYSSTKPSGIYDPSDSDSETDGPEKEEKEVTVTLKNQNMFDDEAYVSVPLLDVRQLERYKAHRVAYAQLLNTWGLPLKACEILKFNGSLVESPANIQSQNALVRVAKDSGRNLQSQNEQAEEGLRVALNCNTCEEPLQAKEAKEGLNMHVRCKACEARGLKTPLKKMSCAICYEAISGLYKACLRCGHIVHTGCLEIWLEENNTPHPECESGCGCSCSEGGATELLPKEVEYGHELQEQVRKELHLDIDGQESRSATYTALNRTNTPNLDSILPWSKAVRQAGLTAQNRPLAARSFDVGLD